MTDQVVIHLSDVGTLFLLSVFKEDGVTPFDLSSATVKRIDFMKGDGTTVSKTASFYTDGKDGILKYVAASSDISVDGKWQMQGYIEIPSGKFHSEIVQFEVQSNLI